MPLRAIRKRLRLIRYYSAARPYGRWNKVLDIALASALVLAWAVTWLLDQACVARSERVVITGTLYRDSGGVVWAWTTPPPAPPDDLRRDAVFYGAWRIDARDEDHGWPFVSSRGPRGAAINVELFEEGQTLGADDLLPDTPVRAAIERGLANSEDGGVAVALWARQNGRRAASHQLRGWLANGLTWSLLLAIAAWLSVKAARFAAALLAVGRTVRRHHRARGGRCGACGYDLRASAYADRCPECGAPL